MKQHGYGLKDRTRSWKHAPERLYVSRALYIGNLLHTVSQGKMKLNSLVDLAFLKEVSLD
jgi:hypothetical protein